MKTLRSTRSLTAIGLVILGEIAYVALAILAPRAAPSPDDVIKLTPWQTVVIQLSVIIPYLVAWLAGIYGTVSFWRCSDLIPESESGRGFRYLGHGVLMLVAGTLGASVIGSVRAFVPPGSSLVPATVIVVNYIYVVTSALSFWFLFKGTNELVGVSEGRVHERDDKVMAVVLSAVITALYVPLVFSNTTRQVALDLKTPATYYIPDGMIVLTIIIPYIVTWFFGFMVALRLARFTPIGRVQTEKRSIKQLVNGLWMTLFASIFLQILESIGTPRLLALGLAPILLLIYVFVILQVVGFILISLSSRRMSHEAEQAIQQGAKPTMTIL